MIKCIIVEDETLAQEVIKNHLQQVDRFELVGTYRNTQDALQGLATHRRRPDVFGYPASGHEWFAISAVCTQSSAGSIDDRL